MKTVKKILLSTFSLLVFVLSFECVVMAAEGNDVNPDETSSYAEDIIEQVATECDLILPENNDSSKEYINFVDSDEKMDSQGNFTFSYSYLLQSDPFKPSFSTIWVYASATSSTNNKTYYIKVKRFSDDAIVGSATYTANGQTGSASFGGLDTNTTYYLEFTLPIFSNATITGSGKINYIQ